MRFIKKKNKTKTTAKHCQFARKTSETQWFIVYRVLAPEVRLFRLLIKCESVNYLRKLSTATVSPAIQTNIASCRFETRFFNINYVSILVMRRKLIRLTRFLHACEKQALLAERRCSFVFVCLLISIVYLAIWIARTKSNLKQIIESQDIPCTGARLLQ